MILMLRQQHGVSTNVLWRVVKALWNTPPTARQVVGTHACRCTVLLCQDTRLHYNAHVPHVRLRCQRLRLPCLRARLLLLLALLRPFLRRMSSTVQVPTPRPPLLKCLSYLWWPQIGIAAGVFLHICRRVLQK